MTTTAPGGGDNNDPPCDGDHVDNSIESICNDRNSPIVEVDENSAPSIPLPNKRKDSFLQKLRRRFSISAGSRRKTSLDSSLPSSSFSSGNRKVSAGVISGSKGHESSGNGSRKISFFRHSFKLSSRKSTHPKAIPETAGDQANKENDKKKVLEVGTSSTLEGSSDPIPVNSNSDANAMRVQAQVASCPGGGANASEMNGSSTECSALSQPPQAKPFVPTPEFVQQLINLFDYPWYWGPLTSSEATTLLETQVDGAFLIRDSEKDVNRVSLSFKSGGRTLHCRIEYQDGLFRFFEGEGFSTIPELIENAISKSRDSIYCYSRSPNSDSTSYSVRLTSPILRTVEPRTLQYLCRFRIRRFARAEKARLPIPPHLKPWLESRNLRF